MIALSVQCLLSQRDQRRSRLTGNCSRSAPGHCRDEHTFTSLPSLLLLCDRLFTKLFDFPATLIFLVASNQLMASADFALPPVDSLTPRGVYRRTTSGAPGAPAVTLGNTSRFEAPHSQRPRTGCLLLFELIDQLLVPVSQGLALLPVRRSGGPNRELVLLCKNVCPQKKHQSCHGGQTSEKRNHHPFSQRLGD